MVAAHCGLTGAGRRESRQPCHPLMIWVEFVAGASWHLNSEAWVCRHGGDQGYVFSSGESFVIEAFGSFSGWRMLSKAFE